MDVDGDTDEEGDAETELDGEREDDGDFDTEDEGEDETEDDAEDDRELETLDERDIELEGEEDIDDEGEEDGEGDKDEDGELETLEDAELLSITKTRKTARLSLLPFSPATKVTRSPTLYPVPLLISCHVAIESIVPSKNSITEVAAAPASPTVLTTMFLTGRNKLFVAEIGNVFAIIFVVKLIISLTFLVMQALWFLAHPYLQ